MAGSNLPRVTVPDFYLVSYCHNTWCSVFYLNLKQHDHISENDNTHVLNGDEIAVYYRKSSEKNTLRTGISSGDVNKYCQLFRT